MFEGGFQGEAFISWANRAGLIVHGEGRNLKRKTVVNGRQIRCVVFKFEENADFIEVSPEIAEQLPFN